MSDVSSLANVEFCYLTTTGRVTGNPHEVEIWFGILNSTIYLMSGGGEESDWVKNLMKNPSVKVRIAQHTFNAAARIVKDKTEEMWVRNRLADKYNERESDGALSEWAQSALVVGLDVRN